MEERGGGGLAGQVALVTGGSRGIGRAVVRELAGAGARVAFTYYRSASAAAELVAELGPRRVTAIQADLGDADRAAGVVEEVAGQHGRLDILVNNAGESLSKPLLDTELAEWERLFAVHARAAFLTSRAALPPMLRRRYGRIVNVSSIWGMVGAANEVAYSAAKAALIGFTKALAREVATAGITVNAVAPGPVETGMLATLSRAEREALAWQIPAGRLGTPEEVALLVRFLVSPEARFLTGQVISPNGGLVT